MELTSEQKHNISIELNASDIYETVPFLNKVLAAIGYVDRLEDDSEREELRWTKRKEPLIKDEKIRKAVRAWAEANYLNNVAFEVYDDENIYFIDRDYEPQIWFPKKSILVNYLDDGKIYTIAELCGEEEG